MSVPDLGLADPAIPASAAISTAAVLSRLLAEAGEELIDRGYLRYKPGTSLLAALRLRSGPAFAYAVSEAARPKLAKLVDRAPAGSLLHWSLSQGLLLARPAADRDLPALADPARLTALAGAAGAANGSPGWTALAYKPQRRWVGRRAGAGETDPVLRAYRRSALAEARAGWRVAERIADQNLVRLPRLVGRSDRLGVLAVGWLPGRPLDRVLADAPAPAQLLGSVGAALAGVHSSSCRHAGDRDTSDPDTSDRHTSDRLRAVEGVADELATVLPGYGSRAATVLQTLRATRPRDVAVRPVHGDFSADQVVVEPDGTVGIADWDRAGWGDPAGDLGSLRASGLTAEAYAAVQDGYQSVRELPPAVRWHAVLAGMLRLTEPLRRCQQDWRSAIGVRLADLEADRQALAGERRAYA